MKHLLASLILGILVSCKSLPQGTDVITLGVRAPTAAAAHAFLGTKLDPSKPVILTEAPLQYRGLLGMTQRFEDHYLITLDSSLDHWQQQMVLVHEWAHVLAWEAEVDGGGAHGVDWGREYSRVFQAWAGEDG